tara:strand:+ start:42 stop:602 length:561 start_codon:yes stop_codon:yes gene_type:complete
MINNSTMNDPHMIILKNYVEKLRKTNPQSYTPNFDPNDGGINAKILFLFEKPGRKTDPSYGGSGYISLDNKDETARATKKFLKEANINRKKIVIWNTIPSWNGTRDISIEERKQASLQLSSLLNVLKNLEFIFLVGKEAQKMSKLLDPSKYKIINSPHPSPINRASRRKEWENIPKIWKQATKSVK